MARIEAMAPLGRAQITYMFLGEHPHAQAHKVITDSTLSGSNIPPLSSHSNNNNNNNNNKSTVPATVPSSAALPTKKNVPNDRFPGHLSGGVNSHDDGLFSLSYFYPVLPIEYIIPPPVTTTSMMMTASGGDGGSAGVATGSGTGTNGVTTGGIGVGGSSSGGVGSVGSSGTVVEAIIGNDVQDVLLVPRESEPPRGMSRWKGVGLRRQDVAALQQQQQQPLSSSQSSSEYRPLFVLQGNFGGKHAHRRDPKGTAMT